MKEAEFKKFMKATLGDIWVDGGSLNDPIMNNNKRILNEKIFFLIKKRSNMGFIVSFYILFSNIPDSHHHHQSHSPCYTPHD